MTSEVTAIAIQFFLKIWPLYKWFQITKRSLAKNWHFSKFLKNCLYSRANQIFDKGKTGNRKISKNMQFECTRGSILHLNRPELLNSRVTEIFPFSYFAFSLIAFSQIIKNIKNLKSFHKTRNNCLGLSKEINFHK